MASYIPALVLEKTDIAFVNSAVSVGAIMEVPTPDNGAYLDGDVWAVPINSFGLYTGWNFIPYNANNPAENVAPNPFAYACTKISATNSSDWFIVLGTSAQYVAAAAGGAALPIVWPTRSHTVPLLPACQILNGTNASGLYILTLGVPTFDLDPTTIQNLFPFGYWNNFALPAATANGYANTTTLLTFLNTATVNTGTTASPVYTGGWAIVGTWTVSGDGITLTATQSAGAGTDIFCGGLITILPSA